MKRPRYTLPSREETADVALYAKSWRELGKPLAEAMGGTLHSFDPDLAIWVEGHLLIVPVVVAKRLLARLGPAPAIPTAVTAAEAPIDATPNRRRQVSRAGSPHARRKATR